MATKGNARARRPRRPRIETNQPGDPGAQPSPAEQAEGVTVSAAEPKTVSRAEFNSIAKIVHQLAIKVGV